MRLMDFMNTNVETITAKETVDIAENQMRLKQIRHLVVMSDNTIIGVLSERNFHGLSQSEKKGYLVEDIMEEQVVTAKPNNTIREAANLMRGRTVGSLPIVNNKNQLVGIITTTDLLDLLGQGIERITPDTPKRAPVTRENPARKPPSFNPKSGKT